MNRNKLNDNPREVIQFDNEIAKPSIVPFPHLSPKGRGSAICQSETFGAKGHSNHDKRAAFHHAGHAVAMYLNSQYRSLPPVFFQIKFNAIEEEGKEYGIISRAMRSERIAHIEGGRLTLTLPLALEGSVPGKSGLADAMVQQNPGYMNALEADIVNLLIGPLSEARYVHDCDNEIFTRHLVDIEALAYYQGNSKLASVHEYLQNVLLCRSQQDKKLRELLALAFDFVKNNTHWDAIIRLAEYVFENNNAIIGYEEIVSVLESTLVEKRKKAV